MELQTQLFINFEDEKGQQIFGTVVNYDWIDERKLLMNVLRIVLNLIDFDSYRDIQYSNEMFNARGLEDFYSILRNECNLPSPTAAVEIRTNIINNICTEGEMNVDTSYLETAILKKDEGIHKKLYEHNRLFSIESLKDAYAANFSNFNHQWRIGENFIIVNIISPESINKSYYDISLSSEIKLGFILGSDYGEGLFADFITPVTLTDYIAKKGNCDSLDKTFIEGYKKIINSYGIKMFSVSELEERNK
ncbi:hypothetical protein ERK19_04930 [Lactobacillus helsingborgensis]|uniref:hypothetical protein n=1 Tax=Lactobacillus helsingborgensis TaxID=1218494 RepID=UPI00164FDFE6|nr:hypothetical protein [Lactobacillus helsingborgensis]MBC6356694.1 hypothetical protein [Lactobacillus helsingborgensis]